MLCDKLSLRLFYRDSAFRKTLHELIRNTLQIIPDDISLPVTNIDRFIAQFPASRRHRIMIHFSRITDRTAHLQCFQSLEFSIMRTCHIAHYIMGMQLRIKFTTCIMRKLSINQLTRRLIIVCSDIFSVPHSNRRKFLQFTHRNTDRFNMCFHQSLVEQTHHGNRFRRRTLKIKKSRTVLHILLRQFPIRFRIDVLLKQTELPACHNTATQTKYFCQFPKPIAPNFFMLRIIIV